MKCSRTLLTCLSLGLLAACGGGGDAGGGDQGTSAGIEKYMGVWTRCMAIPGTGASARVTLNMTKASESSATLVHERRQYPATGTCAGSPAEVLTNHGTVTFAGRVLGNGEFTERVDIVFVPSQGLNSKSMFVLRADGKLYGPVAPGEPGATLDAQGYPNAVDPKLAYERPSS